MVECYFDVVEVISLSLIIFKFNECEFFYFDLFFYCDWIRMDKRFVGLMWGGRGSYIFGSEFYVNMKCMDISYDLEWKIILN